MYCRVLDGVLSGCWVVFLFVLIYFLIRRVSSTEKGNRKREEGKEEYSKLVICVAMISRLDFVDIIAEGSLNLKENKGNDCSDFVREFSPCIRDAHILTHMLIH